MTGVPTNDSATRRVTEYGVTVALDERLVVTDQQWWWLNQEIICAVVRWQQHNQEGDASKLQGWLNTVYRRELTELGGWSDATIGSQTVAAMQAAGEEFDWFQVTDLVCL